MSDTLKSRTVLREAGAGESHLIRSFKRRYKLGQLIWDGMATWSDNRFEGVDLGVDVLVTGSFEAQYNGVYKVMQNSHGKTLSKRR